MKTDDSSKFGGATGPRILVVDDDVAVLTLAKAVLESSGYEALAASSGEEAFEVYSHAFEGGALIELVLLDITLPGGISGVETLDLLKKLDPEVKVIASSGYFDDSAAEAAKERGFVGILPKPYAADRLTKIVQWSTGTRAAAA
ncbi:MAG: response regulator [Verrucomicrobiota bacterium]